MVVQYEHWYHGISHAHVFPGFLTPVLTQLFFPKPLTTFPTCFCRGERQEYAGKKVHPNCGSNSQAPGHESDRFTTEPPGPGGFLIYNIVQNYAIQYNTTMYCNTVTYQRLSLYHVINKLHIF